jgi:chemotaxis protein MotB
MANRKIRQEEQGPIGAPEWMVTFSDCMTLLLTFFVLLLSFTAFGDNTLPNLGNAMSESMSSSIGLDNNAENTSVAAQQQIKEVERVNKGTETKPSAEDNISKIMKKKRPIDFKNLKVFAVPSEKLFWGDGSAISRSGQKVLDSLSVLFKVVPSRVVISENGPNTRQQMALDRSLKVVEYMTSRGLEKSNFSVTTSSMMLSGPMDRRMLEITLLDPSIYE